MFQAKQFTEDVCCPGDICINFMFYLFISSAVCSVARLILLSVQRSPVLQYSSSDQSPDSDSCFPFSHWLTCSSKFPHQLSIIYRDSSNSTIMYQLSHIYIPTSECGLRNQISKHPVITPALIWSPQERVHAGTQLGLWEYYMWLDLKHGCECVYVLLGDDSHFGSSCEAFPFIAVEVLAKSYPSFSLFPECFQVI